MRNNNNAMEITGEPQNQTVMFPAHVGVSGTAHQILCEEYSPSVRRYVVRRRTPHNSPDVSFLGSKIGNVFSLFDLVLCMMGILVSLPYAIGALEAHLFGGGGGPEAQRLMPTASNTVVIPSSVSSSSSAGGVGASADAPMELLRGLVDGNGGTIEHLVHFFTSVVPWFALSQIEGAIAFLFSVVPTTPAGHCGGGHVGVGGGVSATLSADASAASADAASILVDGIASAVTGAASAVLGNVTAASARVSPCSATASASAYAPGWLVNSVHPAAFWAAAIVLFLAVKIPLRVRQVAEEEVLIIQGVGVQVTTRNFLGAVVSQRFTDVSLIRSIFIHEGFFRHRVVFFLAILVENRSDLEVLFEHSLPRLAALRPMLNGIRAVLYPSKKEFGPSLADIANGRVLTAPSVLGGGATSSAAASPAAGGLSSNNASTANLPHGAPLLSPKTTHAHARTNSHHHTRSHSELI